MSLTRKLMLAVTVLIVFLLAGNLVIGIHNARVALSEQMQALTEDAATALGFSLSRTDLEEDAALVQSMVDAVFDRGYYRSIVVTDTHGQAVVSRARDVRVEGVPPWFVAFFDLPQHAGVAEVVSGWYRKGEVSIIAHPGYLYRELWRMFREQLWFLFFIAVLSYGLAGLGLRHILAPLTRIRQQAEAISRKDFSEQKDLPTTVELRRIVESMNYMAVKIREMYQRQVDLTDAWRRDASMDALTQLPNNEEFERQFSSWLASRQDGGPGALILIRADNINELNLRAGREAVDNLLCKLADLLRQTLGAWPRAMGCRRAGGDFALFIPGLLLGELENFLKQFDRDLDMMLGNLGLEQTEISIGAVGSAYTQDKNSILAAADAVLRQAQRRRTPRWLMDSADNNAALCLTARAWVERIKAAQANNTLFFEYQAVYKVDRSVHHYEGFARLEEERKWVSAGIFWPVAERFHLVEELDKHMLNLALAELEGNRALNLAVNLSPASVQSATFREWLAQTLTSHSGVTRLSLELPERILRTGEEALEALLAITQNAGVAVGLDHFGLVPSAFGSLQKLPLSYVKIDRQFIHDFPRQVYYLKTLCQIAQACDVEIIFEGVETEEQWQAALTAGAYAAQGYWLAPPVSQLSPE